MITLLRHDYLRQRGKAEFAFTGATTNMNEQLRGIFDSE
jgi:hypothetical protein